MLLFLCGAHTRVCVLLQAELLPSLLIGSWIVKSARFTLRRCKALRLKEEKGIICSERRLAGRQAQTSLFSNAEQWKVSYLRDLGPGYQHFLLWLFRVLDQRIRKDKRAHRPSDKARSNKQGGLTELHPVSPFRAFTSSRKVLLKHLRMSEYDSKTSLCWSCQAASPVNPLGCISDCFTQ